MLWGQILTKKVKGAPECNFEKDDVRAGEWRQQIFHLLEWLRISDLTYCDSTAQHKLPCSSTVPRERENKTHSCMWAGRYTYTHTSSWSQHTKGTCAYKHTQVKVQTDRREVAEAPSRADNYNQGINSQTLRRFSSKAQPLGFQRVLKWASTDQYLMVDYKGKCWDKIKMKSKQNKQTNKIPQ